MKINYNFDDISELKLFSKKLNGQNIKELEVLSRNIIQEDNKLPDFNKSFNTIFKREQFSAKITEDGLAEAAQNKDTTMTKDNPMSDIIRFKSRYLFPYKIKNVTNENVRVQPDFKGIEISGNLF